MGLQVHLVHLEWPCAPISASQTSTSTFPNSCGYTKSLWQHASAILIPFGDPQGGILQEPFGAPSGAGRCLFVLPGDLSVPSDVHQDPHRLCAPARASELILVSAECVSLHGRGFNVPFLVTPSSGTSVGHSVPPRVLPVPFEAPQRPQGLCWPWGRVPALVWLRTTWESVIAQEQGWKKGHPSSQSSQVFVFGQSGMRGTSLALVSALEIGNPPPWKPTYLCPPSAASTAYRYTASSQLS